MSSQRNPVVRGILVLSLVFRLAVIAGFLALSGWLVFTAFESDPVVVAVWLPAILLVLGIAAYVGGRFALKHVTALQELHQRQRARRESAGSTSGQSGNNVE